MGKGVVSGKLFFWYGLKLYILNGLVNRKFLLLEKCIFFYYFLVVFNFVFWN